MRGTGLLTRWLSFNGVGLMGVGVAMIVLNYMGLLPGTEFGARNLYLWLGLGLIALGFAGATQWR